MNMPRGRRKPRKLTAKDIRVSTLKEKAEKVIKARTSFVQAATRLDKALGYSDHQFHTSATALVNVNTDISFYKGVLEAFDRLDLQREHVTKRLMGEEDDS
jgi:hypothetical protein